MFLPSVVYTTRFVVLLTVLLYAPITFAQNSYLIGNVQLSNLLDNETMLSEIGFQLQSRASIGAQIPLWYDEEKKKESFSLELGVGTYLTSMYFKNALRENPRSQGSGGVISGFFFKAEPIFNVYQNKKRTFFLHASINNVLHILPQSEYISEETRKDSSSVSIVTNISDNAIQFAIEPFIGVSYLWKFKQSNNGLLFRVKRGFVVHEHTIATMRISDTNETSNIKFNNANWTFSMAYLFKSK